MLQSELVYFGAVGFYIPRLFWIWIPILGCLAWYYGRMIYDCMVMIILDCLLVSHWLGR